jgi:hypothetical protein
MVIKARKSLKSCRAQTPHLAWTVRNKATGSFILDGFDL